MRNTTSRLLVLALITGFLALPASSAIFRVVALPDTQNYSEFNPAMFTKQTNWIKSNVSSQSIVFVTHLGDIVNEGWKDAQWTNAQTSMNVLRGYVPFGLCPGNHDLRSVEPETFNSTKFITYFGESYFSGYSWYKGVSPSGFSSYQIVSAGGYDLLFLHMTCDSPDSELSWAKSVLSAHSGVPTIVTTHEYMISSRRDRAATIPGRNSGEAVWNKFIRQYDQIFAVLCGHVFNPDGWHRQISINNAGRKVYEMLSDYQDIGQGWLRVLTFNTSTGTIGVTTYSPHLNEYMTDSGNQFTYYLSIPKRFNPDTTVRVLKPKVSSTFGSGLDGWTKAGDAASTLVRKSDANGKGYLYYTDANGSATDFFVAPSKFTGNLSSYDAITFDFRTFSGGDHDCTYIRLYSGSQYYQWDNNERVIDNDQWERLVASLKDSDLWVKGGGATEDFASFITHITSVTLCAEVLGGTENNGLDNFSLANYEVEDRAVAWSTFDFNRDGWTADADGDVGWDNHGSVMATDQSTGGTWHFCAPSEFLGDKSSCIGGTLQFDLKQSKVDSQSDHDDVIISGGGVTLARDYPVSSNPNAAWTHYTLPLNEYSGWINKSTGSVPTPAEFATVMSAISSFRIRGEYRSGADTAWLDNVVLSPPEPEEVASIAQAKSMVDGTTISITGSFVATVSSSTFTDGSYYVQAYDRSSGIKIVPAASLQPVAEGDNITGYGVVSTDANGERYIALESVGRVAGAPVESVFLTNRAVLDGPDPVGLLIRTWGRLVYLDPAPTPAYAYIDDGSGLSLGSQRGVKVVLSGLTTPITRDLNCAGLMVTGVVSLAQDANGSVIPVIRPRSNIDLLALKGVF